MMSNLVLAEDIKHVKILTVFWKSIKLTSLSTQVIKVVWISCLSKIQRYICVCVWRFCPRLNRAEKDLWLFTRVSLRLAFQSIGNRIVHSEHRSIETVQPSTPLDFLGESPFSVSLPLSHTHTRRWHAYWPQSCVCSLNSDGMLIYRAWRAPV